MNKGQYERVLGFEDVGNGMTALLQMSTYSLRTSRIRKILYGEDGSIISITTMNTLYTKKEKQNDR